MDMAVIYVSCSETCILTQVQAVMYKFLILSMSCLSEGAMHSKATARSSSTL